MWKVFGIIMVCGMFLCPAVCAEESSTVNQVVQEVVKQFYQEEQGNKVTTFNCIGLGSALDQSIRAFQKAQLDESQPEVK